LRMSYFDAVSVPQNLVIVKVKSHG
jgi:hypothetical protein